MRTATMNQIRERYGLPRHITRYLRDTGQVRYIKTGNDQRCTVLVNLDDLKEWLESRQTRDAGGKH